MLKTKAGDTLVEVLFAIAVFSLVSVISLNVMSAGLKTTEGAIEVAQSRSEIDAQAEALRFIHNSFTLERELAIGSQQYRKLWTDLTNSTASVNRGMANEPDQLPDLSVNTCDEVYNGGDKSIFKSGLVAFIMNARDIDQSRANKLASSDIIVSTKDQPARFTATKTYPRVLYTTAAKYAAGSNNSDEQLYEEGDYRYVAAAEGLYIIAIRDRSTNAAKRAGTDTIPEFFDFHIRACWYSPDRDNPTTIGTIIRLYNPEIVENL